MPRIAELPIDRWNEELREMVEGSEVSPLEPKARGIMANAHSGERVGVAV